MSKGIAWLPAILLFCFVITISANSMADAPIIKSGYTIQEAADVSVGTQWSTNVARDFGYDHSQWYSINTTPDTKIYLTVCNASAQGSGITSMGIFAKTISAVVYDAYGRALQSADEIKSGAQELFKIENIPENKIYVYVTAVGMGSSIDVVCTLCSDKAHQITDGKVTKQPTCTEMGIREYECEWCHTVITEQIDMLPHKASDPIMVDPTCISDGYLVVNCTICGTELSRTMVIPANGEHIPSDEETVKAATCTDEGLVRTLCVNCGEILSETPIPALGHQPGEETVLQSADCQHTGISAIICQSCGEILSTSVIPIAGHSTGDWEIIKPAGCTIEGLRQRACTVCGEILEIETLPPSGHAPGEWITIQESTCTEQGRHKQCCKECGILLKEEATPELGHEPGAWQNIIDPTCLEAGQQTRFCQRCGQQLEVEDVPPTGHQAGDWIIVRQPTCVEVGYQAKQCMVCGEAVALETLPMVEHQFGGWSITQFPEGDTPGEQTRACVVCGLEEKKELVITQP